MKNLRPVILVLLLPTIATAQYFDARNNAMGGVGVASSRYITAGVANPALLTRFSDGDRFGFILPVVGAVVSDKDELLDGIEDFQDAVKDLQAKLDAATATPADRANLITRLIALNGRRANANAGGGISIAWPAKDFAWSIFTHTYLDAQVFPSIDGADVTTINSATSSTDLDSLASEGIVLGAAITDVGLAMATEVSIGGNAVSFGLTPKLQRVDTYNYSININNFDEDDYNDSEFREDDLRFNLDAGVAVTVANFVTVGVMARNLISDDFDTKIVNGSFFTYNMDPSITAGVAVTLDKFTLAVDVDVIEIERFKRADEFQQIRGGIEFDAWGHAQLRAGIQHDFEDVLEDTYTAGVGLSPMDLLHIDITGIIAGDNSYGAVVQVSFTF